MSSKGLISSTNVMIATNQNDAAKTQVGKQFGQIGGNFATISVNGKTSYPQPPKN